MQIPLRLDLLLPEIKPGKHKLVIVIYEEGDDSDLTEEMDQAYKKELEIRLKRMAEGLFLGRIHSNSVGVIWKEN